MNSRRDGTARLLHSVANRASPSGVGGSNPPLSANQLSFIFVEPEYEQRMARIGRHLAALAEESE